MSKAPAKTSDPNDLERRILDPNIAKSEAEWWAKSRIEELEHENNELAARIGKELNEENLALQADNVRLRDALEVFAKLYFKESIEALAATADLDKFVLCESDPFGIWHAGDTDEESDFFIFSEAGDVSENCTRCTKLYRAKEQGK